MKIQSVNTFKIIYSVLIIPMFLSSCTFKRELIRVDFPNMDGVQYSSVSESKLKAGEPVMDWWKNFNDPILSNLIRQAFENNREIKSAIANIKKSRSSLELSESDQWPSFTVGTTVTKQRLSEEGLSGRPIERNVEVYEGAFDASWELNFFGRVEQRVMRSMAELSKAEAEHQDMLISVSSEVVRRYMELRGAQYRAMIANKYEMNRRKQYEIIYKRVQEGIGTSIDIAHSKSLWSRSKSEIPEIEALVKTSIFRLSILTGQLPDALAVKLSAFKALPNIPNSILVGEPKDLLRRRGDVRVAEAEAIEATANYNLAVADLYPEITIGGALGLLSSSANEWFSGGALYSSVGPSIRWRILDLHRVKKEIAEADFEAKSKVADFEQVVLLALEDVESAFTSFRSDEEKRAGLIDAVRASRRAVRIAKIRLDKGVDNLLDYLRSEETLIQVEDALARSEVSSAVGLVRVYKALGGEWKMNNLLISEDK